MTLDSMEMARKNHNMPKPQSLRSDFLVIRYTPAENIEARKRKEAITGAARNEVYDL